MKSGEKLFGKSLDFERGKFGGRVSHPVETTQCAVKIHIGMEWQSLKIWCSRFEPPLIEKKEPQVVLSYPFTYNIMKFPGSCSICLSLCLCCV